MLNIIKQEFNIGLEGEGNVFIKSKFCGIIPSFKAISIQATKPSTVLEDISSIISVDNPSNQIICNGGVKHSIAFNELNHR